MPEFAAGQRLTASLLLSEIVDFLPVSYTKGTLTARNTTTTLADDPELKGIALGVGTWAVRLLGFFTLTTTTAQKLKTRWSFTGTWNSPVRGCMGAGFAQTAGPAAATESTFSGYTSDAQDAIYDQAAGGTFGVFSEEALNVVVTVAGTLSLQWAQSASSGNNTTVQAGTGFTIRKVSD